MNTRLGRAGLLPVENENARGQELKQRATDLGIFSDRELEAATARIGRKVPRNSIGKAFKGTASEAIYERLDAALDLLDEEMTREGGEQPRQDLRFTVHNFYGIGEVIAEGPPEMRDELVESLAKLLRDVRQQAEGSQNKP